MIRVHVSVKRCDIGCQEEGVRWDRLVLYSAEEVICIFEVGRVTGAQREYEVVKKLGNPVRFRVTVRDYGASLRVMG